MAKVYAKDPLTGEFVPVGQYNVQPYNDADVKEKIQGNTNRIKTLEDGKVGKKTAEGGEIFNDYFHNKAGDKASSFGTDTRAPFYASVAFGIGTRTGRNYATARGAFNYTSSETIDSIGIAGGESSRRNAVETLVNAKHFIYGVGGYDGTNAVTPNTQGIVATDLAKFLNDSSTLRPLFEYYGAEWHPESIAQDGTQGAYWLNELKDISQFEMVQIFLLTQDSLNSHNCEFKLSLSARTNIPSVIGSTYSYAFDLTYIGFGNTKLEVFNPCKKNTDFFVKGMIGAFYNCRRLKKIYKMDVKEVTNFNSAFLGCRSLKYVYLDKINDSISFGDSPLLDVSDDSNLGSLAFMISHSANSEKAITITLHHDAYVKVSQNLINAALARHITIADATPAQA